VETIFALSSIDQDNARYGHVVAHLDQRYAKEVEDIIISPPAADQYGHLKAELIRRLSSSRDQEVRQLLTREEMGDRTPSQILRHMRTLAKTDFPESVLRTMWADRLPSHVQTIVATLENSTLDATALLADKVYEISQPRQVAAVAAVSPAPDTTAVLGVLVKQLQELTSQVAALSVSRRDKRPFPPRNPSLSSGRRGSSRSPQRPSDGPICWYHSKFGSDAKNCQPPCKFAEQENPSGSQR
jgi:hypothetical protein